ncbi:putative reverse transcriptase domain-containing protein [Tanacetum coccineum]
MEQELWTLTLKGDDIEAYSNRFHELVLMCPELVPTEKKKIEKYVRGFPERIKGNITSSKPATLHEAINMARELVEQSVQGRAARIGESNKRKWEDNQRNNNNNNHNYNNNHNNNNNRNRNNNHHQQQNRRPETGRAYAAAPAGGKIYAGNLPKCNRCNLHHHGPCPQKCQRCQRIGHMEKDCRVRLQGAGNDFLQNVTCFGCGEKGHFKDKCPKAGNQQNDGARGRAYVVVENPQQNPNVVTGTFLLNDHYACILFDSGAEKSFVSSAFTHFINIAPATLNTSYEVELADGKVVSTNTILRSCTLVLLNHVFKIDLLPTRLGSFDVIIGMDWLAYHRALIDCYEKIVRIPLPNGEILEVQGEKPEKDLGSLACIKADEKKLDDIRVVRDFPESEEEHEVHLKTILDLLEKEKLYAKFSKCEFWLKEVQFLGHVVNRDGIHVDPSKVESVKNWKTPESSTEIRSFLGLAGYYQRFIENFSKITKPLTLFWECADAAGHSIAYAVKTVEEDRKIIPTHDLNLGVVVFSLKNWRTLSLWTKKWLSTLPLESPVHIYQKDFKYAKARRIELLSDYECEIKYHPGKANVVADALSRKKRLKPRRVRAMSITIHSGLKTKILEAQSEASKDLKAPAEWLRGLERHFEQRDDGEIYFFDRIWIPSVGDVRKLIMDEAHTSRYSVHPGADKMYYDLRDLYWWPGMKRDIAEYVSRCLTCSKIKAEHQKPSGFLQQPEIPEWKWEKITMDFVTKLPKSSSGHDTIWVVVDRLTKSAHFLPIREDYKTEKLAKIYTNEIVARHGVPVSIISDRDGRFTSHLWQAFQKALGTRLDMSTAYHPQTDGQSERTIQTLEDMLRACVMDFGGSWDTHLPLIEFSYNNSYHMSIKCAPFEALSRQKSYADKRRKPLEFQVGDRVLLKVSPWKGVVRFGKKRKLAPRYVGPFEIVECVGPVAYRLKLPQELTCVHDMFHVSNLKKFLAEPDVQVPLDEIEIDENLRFVEEPIEIVERDVKKLKRRRIPLVKVRWNSRQGAEYTWEREDQFRKKYPNLFSEPVPSSGKANVVADALSRKERLKPRRVRAMSITIHSGLKTKILEAQSEASKDLKAPTEWLRGLERHFEYSVHPGADKMYYDLRDLYLWPGMKGDIAEYLPKSSSGHDTIWVVVDRLTKSAYFLPIREDNKTEKLAKIYTNEIVARHGVPVSIISERDGRFTSHLWQAFQEALGTILDMSTAYHPQTDGQSEHIIQTLEDMLRACVMDFGGSWDTHLSLIEFSYNNSYYTSIKCALFEALYGRKCRSPMIWTEVGEMYIKVSPWKEVVRFGKKGKLAPRYVRPFEIVERVRPVSYRLKLPLELSCVHDMFHVSNLKKCLVESDVQLKRRRIPLVKVRWNSRQGVEYTWEHEDQFRKKYPNLFSEPVPSSSVAI